MVGIIGAMNIEVNGLIAEMDVEKTENRCGMNFNVGKLLGVDAVIVKCGVGKVNAACCSQILCDLYNADIIINTGVAGSLDNRIDIGDIVLSTDAVQHDMDVTPLGYKRGHVPGLENAEFKTDEDLRKLVANEAKKVLPDVKIFEGRVATGDQFINSEEVKDDIVNDFGALCAEMEGASIAQTCMQNNVRCLIIRSISDKADGSSHMDYPAFEKMAADNAIKLLNDVIVKIS